VEKYGIDYEDQYPPIKLIIAHGKEDITIKISDEGGGIPRSEIPLVWTYMVINKIMAVLPLAFFLIHLF
jgi:pyruvate dehydrogenase kinase 2/3/4